VRTGIPIVFAYLVEHGVLLAPDRAMSDTDLPWAGPAGYTPCPRPVQRLRALLASREPAQASSTQIIQGLSDLKLRYRALPIPVIE
jgi:hypothetical protein